ncbi:unnamed protein product, partial [Ixodes pacificus]
LAALICAGVVAKGARTCVVETRRIRSLVVLETRVVLGEYHLGLGGYGVFREGLSAPTWLQRFAVVIAGAPLITVEEVGRAAARGSARREGSPGCPRGEGHLPEGCTAQDEQGHRLCAHVRGR